MAMQYQLGALATCAVVFVYAMLRTRRRPSTIKDVPGPVNSSWIFGMSPQSIRPLRLPPHIDNTDCDPLRTPVVFPCRRTRGAGEEVPRRVRECRSLERSFWGAFQRNACLTFGSFTETNDLRRRIVCGSPTRRPSTTSFRNPVTLMRKRTAFRNGRRW